MNKIVKQKLIISLIIPAYNAEKYITRCLNSCLSQIYSALDIIVINDGSLDSTLDLINGFNDTRITVINKENEGVGKARNDGLKVATGEYVVFLDADDYLPCDAVSKLVGNVVGNVDFIFSGYTIESIKGLVAVKPKYDDALSLIDNFYIDNIVSSPWAKMFKLSVIKKYNIEFENFKIMEDSIFNLKYLSVIDQSSFVKMDESLYFYNKLSQGTTAVISESKAKTIAESLKAQETIYIDYKKNKREALNEDIIFSRKVMLKYLFLARSDYYLDNRFVRINLRKLFSSRILSLRTKIELIAFAIHKRAHQLVLLMIEKSRRIFNF